MPPKIASLVRFFEERQLQEQQEPNDRLFTRAQSQSPARSSSASTILPPPPAQKRRVSAPVIVSGYAATPSRAHRQVQERTTSRGPPQAPIVPSTPTAQVTSSSSLRVTAPPPAASPVSTSSQPAIVKDKAPPASPLESRDSATNIEGRKAGQLIIDKLISTSTPNKPKKVQSTSPGARNTGDSASSPIPIKERFKQRHPLLGTNSTPNSQQETHELLPRRPSQPPVYPGSVTSLTTLVEEPVNISEEPTKSDNADANDESLPIYAAGGNTSNLSIVKDKNADAKFDVHEYLDRPNSSFSSVRTLVDRNRSLILDKEAKGEPHNDTSFTSTRPSLPTSRSSGGISALTADIPAFNIFAADSKPLELPLLDEYIENLPIVKFSQPEKVMSEKELKGWNEWIAQAGDDYINNNIARKQNMWDKMIGMFKRKNKGYKATKTYDAEEQHELSHGKTGQVPSKLKNQLNPEQAKRSLIFPPMHRLPPNITVTDLKYNRSKKAPLVSLNVMLSTAIDAVLGAEGSTYAVSLIRVEAFRDLIQVVGSVTHFAKPASSTSAASALAISQGNSSTIINSLHPFANATIAPFDRTSPGYVILTVVPSILGLDFVSAFGKAILWLWVFTLLCFIGYWEFRMMAREVGSTGSRKGGRVGHGQAGHFSEGLDCEDAYNAREKPTLTGVPGFKWYSRLRRSRGYRITVIFLVTSLYLPLSKISIGALAWTSDFWAVENYYALEDNPTPSLLGPTEQFHHPLEFCYKTTMRKQGWNWSIPILIIASITVLIVTIWFPIRLWFVVQSQVPKIDNFTELGEKRRDSKAEYNRLLERDQSPFSFIYNEYRKPWAGFKSAYMALKLINVLCITLLTKDNCIFRFRHRAALDVIRQSTILGFMVCWMILQIWAKPFNDRYQNNSDWCSRIAYVVIAILGLAAALRLPGKAAYGGWLLVSFTAISYVFNGYFAIIGTVFAQRTVKKWQRRLDFSIDVFAPNLDTAKHIIRRIQQEMLSTLLLAEPEYKVRRKPDEPLVFCNLSEAAKLSEDGDGGLPPYLLGFAGSQGERHLENLKILREMGLPRYVAAVEASRDPSCRLRQLQDIIMEHFTGPDCVWWSENLPESHFSQTGYFGRATVLPFPFTLVFRYDENDHVAVLSSEHDFETYVAQNESPEARSGRRLRLVLRALEGCRCYWPHAAELSTARALGVRKSKTLLGSQVRYNYGLLRIERNLDYAWRGYNYNSGFKVRLEYHDGRFLNSDGTYKNGFFLALDGEDLGIASNFALSNTLARFLQLNRDKIEQNVPKVGEKLAAHRDFFREEMQEKRQTLSYAFLIDVYGNEHFDRASLQAALDKEQDEKTRAILDDHTGAVRFLEERMQAANRDIICQWWYLLWDDIYRRNCNSISQLQKFESDFSPKFRSSICYRPMTRQVLESFLNVRGLWIKDGKKGFFTHGILNRIYFYMDEMLFAGTKAGISVKVGRHRHPVGFHELGTLRAHDAEDSFGQDTKHTYDTGQGTDHDESFVRNRPAFLFEEMYERSHAAYRNDTAARIVRLRDRVSQGVQIWFGIRPYESATTPPSLYFSLRETQGGYAVPRRSM